MKKRLIPTALAMAIILPLGVRAHLGTQADELAVGIRQVEEGDLDTAVITLDTVIQRLKKVKGAEKDLATAHLYLGMAHLGLSQWERAKAEMLEAWRNNKEMRLDPKKFSPRTLQTFEDAKREAAAADAAAKQADKQQAVKPAPSPQAPDKSSGSPAAISPATPATVRALPKPVGDTQLDLSDLATRAETEKAWAEYQSRLAAAFQSTEQFERGAGSAELKATAWERFLSVYAQDNPLSGEDDRLRGDARGRVQRWKAAAAAAVEVAKATVPAFNSPPAGGGSGGSGGRVSSIDGLTYVPIPAGAGVSSFWMSTTEVTVSAYERFARSSGQGMPKAPQFNAKWSLKDHPVVNVDWNKASTFCAWSGGRLPSKKEWEHAARGGLAKEYPWGDTITHEDANYGNEAANGKDGWNGLVWGRDRWEYTSPVGSFAANGYALFDMAGNVKEWTAHSSPSGRVLHGGSWDDEPKFLAISSHLDSKASDHDNRWGFRCSRDAFP